ncbi:MAG: beta-ketoacyl-ACP synthase II [Kiritimatiellae bacterium]|nr:beta-ketoacyl-ACP synthase II [Kiritimatiellia bacterium]
MAKRRVVVTGMGVVSPLGCTVDALWDGIKSGRSGIGLIESFDTTDFKTKIAAEVVGFDVDAFIDKKEQRRLDAFGKFAIAAAKMAMDDSGIDMSTEDPDRIGVIVGSGIGGMDTFEKQHTVLADRGPSRVSPFVIPQMISNIPSGLIAIRHNLQGPNFCVVSACASAAHSIGTGLWLIQRGTADAMVLGGTEASICKMGIAGFSNMKALSQRNDAPEKASRPFDRDRDGFVMGEGAAIIVVEEREHAIKRGARIYCELSGFGMTCDAFHITAPAADGAGAAKAMKLAMQDAEVDPDAVDYINAHGTSTPLNDKVETRAIKSVFGDDKARKLMISSSKSMTGHLLGAAAGIESVICALALYHGVVPPTMNQETPDPDCDLDYVPNVARESNIEVCLNTSLGFGGHNACLAFQKNGG